MRQWLVNPKFLCRKHLLGEHVEHHMFIGTILKKSKLKGYLDKGLLQVETLESRHEELVKEMLLRGYNHKSEFPKVKLWKEGKINISDNIEELKKRCSECKKRIESFEN